MDEKQSEKLGRDKTSQFGCYVFLTKSIMGAGMLQLSSVCLAYGWVLGIGLCIFASLMTIVALIFNAQLAKDHPGKMISFYTVSKHISPGVCWLIDIACALDCFGACVGYIQVTGMTVSQILLQLFPSWSIEALTLGRYVELIMIAALAPFCFSKGISKTAVLSAIGLACITYVSFIPLLYIGTGAPDVVTPVWPESFWGSMRKLPVYFFAFSCMQNLFTVVNDIDVFTTKRVNIVFTSAVLTGLCIYLVVMLVPFATFGKATQVVFLDNYDKESIPVQIAFIATAIQVSIGYVLVLHPTRQSVLSLWHREVEPQRKNEVRVRIIITAVLIVSSLGIALLTNSLETVTEITGLLGANTYCFTAPSYMFFLRYHPKYFKDYDALSLSVNPDAPVYLHTKESSPHRALWHLSIWCLVISAFLYPVCLSAIIFGMVTTGS